MEEGYIYQIKYGYDGQRRYSSNLKAGVYNEIRYYFGLYEEYLNANTGEYKEYYYIPTPSGISSVYIKNHKENTSELCHILTDYLGSTQYIVGSDTSDVKKLSFDAWGITRSATDWTITPDWRSVSRYVFISKASSPNKKIKPNFVGLQ